MDLLPLIRAAPRLRPAARFLVVVLLGLLPSALLVYLLGHPEADRELNVPLEHFVVTSNVAVVAAVAGFLIARSAGGLRQIDAQLAALGFLALAGIFAVHGLSTPGVLQRGERADDAALVVGLSAQLALSVPAVLFALRGTSLAALLGRRLGPARLTYGLALALGLYAAVGLVRPEALGSLARGVVLGGLTTYDEDVPPGYGSMAGQAGTAAYAVVAVTIALYLLAASREGAEFLRGRRLVRGALGLAFVLLAQAQLSQLLGPVWRLSWWEYHALMLAATVVALGAIVVELDRRRGLERFLPPSVVTRVIAGDPLRLGGERHHATILFADLRGSTDLADRLAPEAAVDVVNAYLREMAAAVIAEGGILDKFLGDGLMAIFGVLDSPSAGAAAAARAALRIRRRLGALSAARAARGEATAGFGVGIHSGDVVLGVIGLPERSDFTALGDAVNTASRMESLTKELGVDVVLSADTAVLLGAPGLATRALGTVAVRGKAQPVAVHTLA